MEEEGGIGAMNNGGWVVQGHNSAGDLRGFCTKNFKVKAEAAERCKQLNEDTKDPLPLNWHIKYLK